MSKECDGKMLFNIKSLMLPLDSITEFGDECYAHLSEDETQKETLTEHTRRCQKYWFNIVEAKHIETVFIKFEQLYMGDITNEARHIFELMSVNVVTLHDVGKINPLFQKLKMKNNWKTEYAPESISSRHSIVSAIFYLDYFLDIINTAKGDGRINRDESDVLKDFAYIYSYIISRHHSDMNSLEYFFSGLTGKNTEGDNSGKDAYDWYEMFKQELYKEPVVKLRKRDEWLNRMAYQSNEKNIYLYAWTRLLYSLLVAADYYATSEFMNGYENNDYGNVNNIDNIINEYENNDVQKSIRNYEKNIKRLDEEQLAKVNKDTVIGNIKGINVLRTEMFLETEYNISREHILYIHGDRRQKFGSLVLGHNVEDNEVAFDEWVHKHKNRRRYRPNLKDKKGKYFANDKLVYLAFFLKDMKKGNWKNPIRYYAVDHIEERLENYYAKNIKHSNDIIDHNLGFFESLNDLKEITLLGHSLGDVDFPYFKAIVENVRNVDDLIWNFSYYSDNDIKNIRRFCRHLNIPQGKNVRHFKMSDIKR